MEFNEVINLRKTSREWTDREVDCEAIKRLLEAGMKAPSWDYYRNWQFIVLHEREDKERAFAYAKAVANEGLGYSLRIPLNREHDVVLKTLGVPQGWMTPCFIGVGYPKEDELVLEQYSSNPDGHIHMGGW